MPVAGQWRPVCRRGSVGEFHTWLSARADELCELADVVLCAYGPVLNLAALSLAPGHRRGHGAVYDAVNRGRIEIARLRRCLACLPLPRAADDRCPAWVLLHILPAADDARCYIALARSGARCQVSPAGEPEETRCLARAPDQTAE